MAISEWLADEITALAQTDEPLQQMKDFWQSAVLRQSATLGDGNVRTFCKAKVFSLFRRRAVWMLRSMTDACNADWVQFLKRRDLRPNSPPKFWRFSSVANNLPDYYYAWGWL